MDLNRTIDTILNRRSTRSYRPDQLKEQELQTILEAGRYAPSALNQQPWHFTAVQNSGLLAGINDLCLRQIQQSGNQAMIERAKAPDFSIFYHAPTVIIVSADPQAILPQIDCALAMENMFLAADSLAVGSCWIHAVTQIFNRPEGQTLCRELGVPDGYALYAAGAFGYAAGDRPAPTPRKPGTVTIIV